MKLAETIQIHAGGPGSGCQGPNCGRKATGRFSEGQRVRRNPAVSPKWKDTPETKENNHGTIVSVEHGKDNKGKSTQGYRVRSDADAKLLDRAAKGKLVGDEKWDVPGAQRGTWYAEKELVEE